MRIGSVIAGRFRIEAQRGAGASATAWRATDLAAHRPVIVKVLARDPVTERRWRRELDALSNVQHRGLPALVAAGEVDERQLFTAMSCVDGRSLREALRGPMDAADVRALGLAVCEPLAALHSAGVVHRDIKPEHIVLDPEDERGRASLIDLGLSARAEQGRELTAGGVIGTLGYVPPEQLVGEGAAATARWDVFSLGCVLFECATGHAPFGARDPRDALARTLATDAPDPRSIVATVPEELAALIRAMISSRSDERPEDAMAVRERLASLRVERPAEPPPSSERFIAVLVALPEAPASSAETTPMLVATAEKSEEASVLDPSLMPRGARSRSLADGSLLVWITSATLDRSFAVRAVQCATLLCARDPTLRWSIALSEGATRGGWPTGPAFDRALALVAGARAGSVVVDSVAALYADGAIALESRGDAFVIRAESKVGCAP